MIVALLPRSLFPPRVQVDKTLLLRRAVASSVSRFCSAIKESLRVDEEEEEDSGSSSDDDSSSDSSSEDSEDSELQRLHPSGADSPISSVEEPLSAAESDCESASESDSDHEAASDEAEDDEEIDGSEEVDDPNETDAYGPDEVDAPDEGDYPNEIGGLDEIDAPGEVDEPNEEQKADKTAESMDDAVRRAQRLAVARIFQRRQGQLVNGAFSCRRGRPSLARTSRTITHSLTRALIFACR